MDETMISTGLPAAMIGAACPRRTTARSDTHPAAASRCNAARRVIPGRMRRIVKGAVRLLLLLAFVVDTVTHFPSAPAYSSVAV